jgi:PKHD-type hydroxylase
LRTLPSRVTANEPAKLVKHNLQLDERDALHTELSKAIAGAVLSNSLFQIVAWPKTMLGFRFSRYDPGMGYGEHVDDPLFQGHRSDVSMTIFLSDPEGYDGGELVIEWGGIERAFKRTKADRPSPVSRATIGRSLHVVSQDVLAS